MLKLIFIIAFVAAHPSVIGRARGQECPSCPSGFTKIDNKCLLAFSTKKTWDDAYQTCLKLNSHLVVIRGSATNDALYKAIEPVKDACKLDNTLVAPFWTAGKRDCSKTEFVWVTTHGTKWPMLYTNWIPGEPNNAGSNEHCLHVQAQSNLGWNDAPCGYAYCFVCEIDL